jgi:hypothetical protein
MHIENSREARQPGLAAGAGIRYRTPSHSVAHSQRVAVPLLQEGCGA